MVLHIPVNINNLTFKVLETPCTKDSFAKRSNEQIAKEKRIFLVVPFSSRQAEITWEVISFKEETGT